MKIEWKAVLGDRRINLADFLVHRHHRDGFGNRTALIYQKCKFSYSEVSSRVSQASNYLAARGISHGDRVMLAIPDTPAFVIAFFAVIACGGVAVLANPLHSADEMKFMLAHADIKLLIIEDSIKHKAFAAMAATDALQIIVTGDFHLEQSEFEAAIARQSDRHEISLWNSDHLAYVLFSSGTTGKPKAIPRRHRDILHCSYAFAEHALEMNIDDRVLAVPKLAFGYGLGGSLLFSFIFGGTAILFREKTSVQILIDLFLMHKPSIFLGTPRVIAEILKNNDQKFLTSLRIATSAGENLSESILETWQGKLSVPLLDGFGSTEVGHIFLSNNPKEFRPGTVGKCLNSYRIKVIDVNGMELNDGEIGRLCIAGPSVADAYLNDPQRSTDAFVKGWHVSNDLFRLDEGFATYIGRSDDMIKKGCGEWVSPYEIESEILKQEAVLECAVVGDVNEAKIIVLKACVVCKDGIPISSSLEKEIRNSVQRRWPDFPHKHIDIIDFMEALPRNSAGKVQRHLLRQKTLTEYSYDC